MALIELKPMYAPLHIEAGTITNAEIATGAAIAQSKIADLVTDLAARTVRAADETIAGNWTFSNPVIGATGVNANHFVTKSQLDSATANTAAVHTAAANLAALKAVTGYQNDQLILLRSTNEIYRYSSSSSATSDDLFYVRPDDVASDASNGRYIRVNVSAFDAATLSTAQTITGAKTYAANVTINGSNTLSVGGATTLSGAVTAASTLAVAGDFAVNTNKFTVAASTGNTLVAGTLDVTGATALSSVATSGNASVGGNLTVTGDLTINGSTTYVNSTDLAIEDKLIHLNVPATPGANDPVPTGYSGLAIERGTASSVAREASGFIWDEANSIWRLAFLSNDTTVGAGGYQAVRVGNLTSINGNFSGTLSVTSTSTLTGAVTASNGLTVTAGGATITAGGLTVSAGGAAITGNSSITGTLGVSGDFAINTNKFTVAASSGNTLVAGTLNVTGAADFDSTLNVDGTFSTTAGRSKKTRVVTVAGAVTVTASDDFVATNKGASQATTITLPAAPETGMELEIKDAKGDASGQYPMTVDGNGKTIDGAATEIVYNPYGYRVLRYNGTEWNVVSREPKKRYQKVVLAVTNGTTSITKNANDPPIPDTDETEVIKDGRSMIRGSNANFTVNGGGGAVTIASTSGQPDLVLRYWI